ncbi:MAG: hypothetical protein ACI959_001762 [Limisphaerales bacterium]|jgi:hypothetical protein
MNIRHLILLLFVFAGVFLSKADAQVVYIAEHKDQANKIVFLEEEVPSKAALIVYKSDWKSDARPNSGIWYITEWKSEADFSIYFTDFKSEADLVISYTEVKSEAGPQ